MAGFLVDGWWGVGIAVAVVALAAVLLRAFRIGQERDEESPALLGARVTAGGLHAVAAEEAPSPGVGVAPPVADGPGGPGWAG